MIRGLYTACAGMMVQMARQDVLANNLANTNSSGFKKDTAISQAFPEALLQRIGETRDVNGGVQPLPAVPIGLMGTGAVVKSISTDYSSGSLRATENKLDFALRSDGFFSIETPQGIRYTRDGSFKISPEGRLVTTAGYPVLGEDGYIEVDGDLRVDENGLIFGGEEETRFLITRFEDNGQLKKVGDNLFEAGDSEGYEAANPQVLQGYLEGSNVNAVQEMVNLITVVRAYEMSQKVVQAEDETLDKAVNQIGRL